MDRDNIEEILKRMSGEDVPADVQKIAEETARDFSEKQTRQPRHYVLLENIMRSRITKLAAAAVIVIAVIAGVSQFFGGTVTFAEVIKPILNARTVVFDFIVGDEETGTVMHDIVAGSRIRRTFSNADTILILDLDNAKMLTLDPKSKGAVYMDIKGPIQEGTQNTLEFIRNIITKLEQNPNILVQKLGRKEIDGREAVGFFIDDPAGELTIWADPKTALPVRIEMMLGQSLYICKHIKFDVPVDESLISMEPPADYKLAGMEYNMSQLTEQDFIESIRLWAELLLNGMFPEELSVGYLMSQTAAIGQKLGQSNILSEEGTRLGVTFGRGAVFFQQLDASSSDWHYAGNGVKLGEADKAIFWYQPKGSGTYRVIYGDLQVEDIAPENLPK